MIPVYEAQIKEEMDGVYAIALVDSPAVESDFIAFKKQEKILFSIHNNDQHTIYGPIMRADYLIYRYNEKIGEFYIKYSKETIKKMAVKMLEDKTFNNFNIMHTDKKVDGIKLEQLFIKDVQNGIDPKQYNEIEDGSLFGIFKVEDDELWKEIKEGDLLRGFSLEGYFSIEKTNEEMEYKKINNTNMIKNILKMMKTLIKLGSVETDKQTLYWLGEGDLKVGDEVFTDGDDTTPAEDGEYITLDGKTIVVADGKVSEIVDPEAEVAEEVEAEEETPAETPAEEPANDEIKRLEDLISKLEERVVVLEEKLKTVEETPAEDPLEEQYSKQKGAFNNGKIQLVY